jgi:hypothetical protein
LLQYSKCGESGQLQTPEQSLPKKPGSIGCNPDPQSASQTPMGLQSVRPEQSVSRSQAVVQFPNTVSAWTVAFAVAWPMRSSGPG